MKSRFEQRSAPYVMESATEAERLETKTDPDETRRQLALVGLASGMHVLDAGAGTGAVARVVSAIVGPEGRVVALDRSRARIERGELIARAAGLDNLSFVEAALEQPPHIEGAFDLVWCRFVFEYLPDPDLVLDHLVRYARVGGKVVVGDLDGAINFHYPASRELVDGIDRLLSALEGSFDPFSGRKIFNRMRRRGLSNLHAHVMPYHLFAGTAPGADIENWREKFETIRDIGVEAFGGSGAYERFAQCYLDHLQDPDVFTYSTLVLVEGIRNSSDVLARAGSGGAAHRGDLTEPAR